MYVKSRKVCIGIYGVWYGCPKGECLYIFWKSLIVVFTDPNVKSLRGVKSRSDSRSSLGQRK